MGFPLIPDCFPGSTIVTTLNGVKRMDQLIPSDKVLTISGSKGIKKWTTFYTWGHREPGRAVEYLVIKMCNGKTLQISKEHLLFVEGSKDGKRVTKQAHEVKTGDKLFHLSNNGIPATVGVQEITMETIVGVYAPFTMSGTLIVNDFLVSCYADVATPTVLHAMLAPLRSWYKIREEELKGEIVHGYHGYVKQLLKARDVLPRQISVHV